MYRGLQQISENIFGVDSKSHRLTVADEYLFSRQTVPDNYCRDNNKPNLSIFADQQGSINHRRESAFIHGNRLEPNTPKMKSLLLIEKLQAQTENEEGISRVSLLF